MYSHKGDEIYNEALECKSKGRGLINVILTLGCLLPQIALAFVGIQPTRLDSTASKINTNTETTTFSGPTTSMMKAQTTLATDLNGNVQILGIKIGGIFDKAIPRSRILVNDNVLILVSNPKALLALKPTDRSDLILYADELPLKGIRTTYFTRLGKNDLNDKLVGWPAAVWIPFIFSRDSTNMEAWNTLFRITDWDKNVTRFHLSLGWEGMYPIRYGNKETQDRIFELRLYNTAVFWLLLCCYLGFLCFFIWLCRKTGLIREPDNMYNGLGPYSLAQTQLAFWTVIIVGGFIYLTILTGLTNSLNDSSLLLLGITGGTTGVASFIDYFTPESLPIRKPHRGFLRDISSDGAHLNMQRAQTILWNLVLGVYFIWYVVANKAMPVFSNTLLTLAGVSSLVYLSSKTPDKATPGKTKDIVV